MKHYLSFETNLISRLSLNSGQSESKQTITGVKSNRSRVRDWLLSGQVIHLLDWLIRSPITCVPIALRRGYSKLSGNHLLNYSLMKD